jgi:copper chaperone
LPGIGQFNGFSTFNNKFNNKEFTMTTKTFVVPGISCGHCTHTIESELSEVAGVQSVKADQNTKQVTVAFDAPATLDKIVATLEEINYPPANELTLQ